MDFIPGPNEISALKYFLVSFALLLFFFLLKKSEVGKIGIIFWMGVGVILGLVFLFGVGS